MKSPSGCTGVCHPAHAQVKAFGDSADLVPSASEDEPTVKPGVVHMVGGSGGDVRRSHGSAHGKRTANSVACQKEIVSLALR
jgi:hypothetical protein